MKNMPGERTDLVCPDCKALMVLKTGRHGLFYGCTNHPNCKGSHGACADGSPKGIPTNAETRKSRQQAIGAVDALANYLPSAAIEDCEAVIQLAEEFGLIF